MIKYKILYQTNLNEYNAEVQLDVEGFSGTPIELKAGANPFMIDTQKDDVTTPIRASSATLEVFGGSYLQDLYTSNPFGIKVLYFINGEVNWVGYVTQDTFSQDYTNPEFLYQIECVCALSALKHKKYDIEDGTTTLLGIIKKAIDYAGYGKGYLTNTVRTVGDGNLYSTLKVASANFFDELDEASTYYEVMEEIAKYTSCTWTPYKGDLMLINYEAIKEASNYYYRIDTGAIVAVKFEHQTTVQELGYRGTGATLSRIAGKNKAVVRCSLNELRKVMPDINSDGMRYERMEETTQDIKVGKEMVNYRSIMRFFTVEMDGGNFDTFNYKAGDIVSEPLINSPITGNDIGSEFVRYTDFESMNQPNTLNLSDVILTKRGNGTTMSTGKPILRVRSKNDIMTQFDMGSGKGAVFVLNFEMKATTTKTAFDSYRTATGAYTYMYNNILRFGDMYYNGIGWQYGYAEFGITVDFKKDENVIGTWKSVKNKNTYTTGLGGVSGWLINAPFGVKVGELEWTICDFYVLGDDQTAVYTYAKWNYMKNITLQIAMPDEQSIYGDYVNEESKNDALYEKEIAGGYTEEADTVNLNICTNPEGKICLSSVFTDTGYVEQIKHLGVNVQPEHNIVNKAARLYDRPRLSINPTVKNTLTPFSIVTDENLPGTIFIAAGGEEDTSMESVTINLIEI